MVSSGVDGEPEPKRVSEETMEAVQGSEASSDGSELDAILKKNPPTREKLDALLAIAAEQGHAANVRSLLAHGAKPDGNGDGAPLMAAATAGKTEVVDLLLEKGADPNKRTGDKPTILAELAATDQSATMARLLEAKADPNVSSHWVERRTRKLRFGNPSMTIADRYWTPLMIAASMGKSKMVETLLNHGSDKSLQSPEGTAYEIAKERGHSEAEKLLKP